MLYLPQEVTTKEGYEAYVSRIKDIDYTGIDIRDEELVETCSTGACPIR